MEIWWNQLNIRHVKMIKICYKNQINSILERNRHRLPDEDIPSSNSLMSNLYHYLTNSIIYSYQEVHWCPDSIYIYLSDILFHLRHSPNSSGLTQKWITLPSASAKYLRLDHLWELWNRRGNTEKNIKNWKCLFLDTKLYLGCLYSSEMNSWLNSDTFSPQELVCTSKNWPNMTLPNLPINIAICHFWQVKKWQILMYRQVIGV